MKKQWEDGDFNQLYKQSNKQIYNVILQENGDASIKYKKKSYESSNKSNDNNDMM